MFQEDHPGSDAPRLPRDVPQEVGVRGAARRAAAAAAAAPRQRLRRRQDGRRQALAQHQGRLRAQGGHRCWSHSCCTLSAMYSTQRKMCHQANKLREMEYEHG